MADFPSPVELLDTLLESQQFDETVELLGEYTGVVYEKTQGDTPDWLEDMTDQLIDTVVRNQEKIGKFVLTEAAGNPDVLEFHNALIQCFLADNEDLLRVYLTSLLAANIVHQHEKESV